MDLKSKMFEAEKKELLDLKQKARLKWAHSGDENSKYFHRVIKQNHRRNFIHGFSINGVWTTDPMTMKSAAKDFFENKFKEPLSSRPVFSNTLLNALSSDQSDFLEATFSSDEIKQTVWACDGDKAQGSDGFSFSFIKSHWEILRSDIIGAVSEFYDSASLPRGANSSFLALVPKSKDLIYISDYRPISLIGATYKIIAKLLSSRLQAVIHSIIGKEQTAFIKGRSILEGPMILNEIISWAKRSKQQMLLFKIDLEKAFDSLNWEFLDKIMEKLNFGTKWRRWIRNCLSSARISVLINGSASGEFSMQRGVRQGDPLAPFLFIIAMEALNAAMKQARSLGIFEGIQLPKNGLLVSHLFYADDAFVTPYQEKKEREIFGFSSSTAQLWENGSFSFFNRRIVVKFGQRLHNSLFFNLTGGIEHRRLQ
ncbi:hypothetical protein OSB04_021002 [Centaurea solstitialis]|uniref:Reverse transcriptase domain-containing protein n=1 Tax=Centaurea solstitialis TaxID=347529 RepID=A0AA38STE5_9ASTR|nr:hypothetical protein OSB04_021002 [Centaurea solstitialis]